MLEQRFKRREKFLETHVLRGILSIPVTAVYCRFLLPVSVALIRCSLCSRLDRITPNTCRATAIMLKNQENVLSAGKKNAAVNRDGRVLAGGQKNFKSFGY